MRRYDDPVEVRRGRVGGVEAPEQFLWRGRLWKVRAVLATWTETGAWWASREVDAVLGTDAASAAAPNDREAPDPTDATDVAVRPVPDLLGERELWRLEAGRGGAGVGGVTGVFDLAHDDGRWALVGCAD